MCEFISWIETNKGNIYLTKEDLKGKRFREYKEYNKEWKRDIIGHGAIRYFYGEDIKGIEKECVDFSNSNNFPKDIVRDIKKGLFEGLGICKGILNKKGAREYEKIKQPALEKYEKIKQPALEKYEKIIQSALEKYEKIIQSALEKYEKIEQPALEKYEKIKQPAFWNIVKQKRYRRKEWK